MTKPDPADWKSMAIRSGVCLAGGLTGWAVSAQWPTVSTAAYMVAYLAGAWDLAREVWTDLLRLRFDTHFLMLLVVPGSVAVGAFGEAALLLFLFSASAAMEHYASGRTRREIDALLRRAPKSARLLVDGRESVVPVDALKAGDTVRVTSGELVPVDLKLLSGQSACDESMLTGESDSVPKGPGDDAMGGTLNLWGVVEGRVLRPAADSALQRILQLIDSAQHLKAPSERFTDRFGSGYTVAVLTLCLAVFLFGWQVQELPPFFSDAVRHSAFYRAMTLLVVLSPCALVLSVPSAILSAIAAGARSGILFRGGAAIENLAGITVVAMDKTGTLTEGELKVVAVEPLEGNAADLFAAAASLARISNHPVSRSLAREADGRGVAVETVTDSGTVAGRGVHGIWRGARHHLGNRAFLAQSPPGYATPLPNPPGTTTETWLAGPGLRGRILLQDTLRSSAREVVARLRAHGLHTAMLTGDREEAARRIHEESGIDEARSGLKPEDKVAAIREYQEKGHRVAMIGDGVNDAPCLVVADVGVAMGSRGSDAAIEQAEVVLMHDRLENFLHARELSERARRIIRQNIAVSLGTIAIMAVLTLSLPRLPLSMGVAAHEGSTVLVVLNSLRLLLARRPSGANPQSPPPKPS
jgi:Cd2+/Zn2+-exporting ATPase